MLWFLSLVIVCLIVLTVWLGYRTIRLAESDWRPAFGLAVSALLLGAASGIVCGLLMVPRGSGRQLRAEEELRKLFRAIEHSPATVMITDAKGDIEYVNPKFTDLTGYTTEEVIGQNPRFLKAGDQPPEFYKQMWETIAAGNEWRGEFCNRNKQGQIYWEYASISPVQDDRGVITHYVSVKEDVTARKEAEEKLEEYQDQLRRLALELAQTEDQQRRQIADDLHDRIGQHLAAVKIRLQLLRQSAPADSHAAVDRILELIEQTIQDTWSLTFELSPPMLYELGLEPALEWLVERYQQEHEAIRFTFHDDQQPKALAEAVRGQAYRCVRELLLNAVRHAQAGHVTVSVSRSGPDVHLCVGDDGVGFDAAQAEAARPQAGGFGLFSVRERLRRLGGRIEIEAQPGRGCRIALILPHDSGYDGAVEAQHEY